MNEQKSIGKDVFCPETGEMLSTTEAVRAKVRLYPRAMTQELVAMFKLEGVQVSPALIQRVREEMLGNLPNFATRAQRPSPPPEEPPPPIRKPR
jgi:hypothetical protein